MWTIRQYVEGVLEALYRRSPSRLKDHLCLEPSLYDAAETANCGDLSDIDLYQLPEKFRPLIRSYVRLLRSIYKHKSIDQAFENFLLFMGDFNRMAETMPSWVCTALISSSNELLSVYQVRARNKDKAENDESLERVSTVIHRSFKICLTDKSTDPATSKKSCIHFFLASLIKIYFKLDHIDLAKSMEKALMGTNSAIPAIINCPAQYRMHVVTYLYYSSLLSLDDGDYPFAEVKLLTALEFLACYGSKKRPCPQEEKILMLVVPLKYLSSRKQLPEKVYEQFPNLKFIYKDRLLKAVKQGNISAFDDYLQQFHKVFLSRHIYLLALRLKQVCYLSLVRKTANFYKTVTETTPHIVPFAYFQAAFTYSQSPDAEAKEEVSMEQVECILTNLIVHKHVKGYLSHSNKCIVLSKTDAFPAPAPASS
ncbi:hypothetical protein FT663_03929 [Candidozyma haemuli var. vulneris]|uniref:PCI domain-containing protein n=1 Tax=Candidozyma haemuli TaxID=45357 RepID=A0A2V1ASR1_9ASCO|nr:hypothetical protein CXQ85_004343 [[Candida] haemuloni]KAF3988697.1 hypothetical protein FT663_03929 [[Candida] haemuloni var. vulneris]KAF3990448.1 hypothetical protein FT662_02245 [[Candida] haemuloni var. vulneris]PVH20835.1 hypothetical protein CXQ85_004343 [[Candida] haemuloni]